MLSRTNRSGLGAGRTLPAASVPSGSMSLISVILAVVLTGCEANTSSSLVDSQDAPSQNGCVLREFESEKAFTAFMEERKANLRAIDAHARPSLKLELTGEEWKQAMQTRKVCFFDLPDRQIPVLERSLGIGPHDQQEKLVKAVPLFPEISSITVDTDVIEPLVQLWTTLPHLRKFWLRKDIPITRIQAKVLGEHPTLQEVSFWSTVSDEAFEFLAHSASIEEVLVANASPRCFISLSRMPRIQRFSYGEAPTLAHVGAVGFRQPIDDDVRRAIASLDGRLEAFSTSEEAEIHSSIFRSLLDVKSLKTLRIRGGVWGGPLTSADIKRLQELTRLTDFTLTYDFKGWSAKERSAAEEVLNKVKRDAAKRAEAVNAAGPGR